MNILRFQEFVNESYLINESGVPLYRGQNFNPERTIKRNKIIQEIQDLLSEVMAGSISEVTVLADIPTQGKNAPQYIKDLYGEMGMEDFDQAEEFEDDIYDPETGTYKKMDYEEKEKNIFVDSEFLVKDVDTVKGVIIGVPYSMKRKDIRVEIDPEVVEEVFVK